MAEEFTCAVDEIYHPACKDLPKYSGSRYCVLHEPDEAKSKEDFLKVKKSKLDQKDYDFRGTVFPEGTANFGGFEFDTDTNFTDATFIGGSRLSGEWTSFRNAKFSGEWTSFRNAKFSGGWTDFFRAQFSSERTDFSGAQFSGERTQFDSAKFSGESTFFTDARFSSVATNFSGARFSSVQTGFSGAQFSSEGTASFAGTDFSDAKFSGEWTSFRNAKFSGGLTAFFAAQFSSERTDFSLTKFSGEWTLFFGAKFGGKSTNFALAECSGGGTQFGSAKFNGEYTEFDRTKFSSERTDFSDAKFSGENTAFERAKFSGERTDFSRAEFSGERTSFSEVEFGSTRVDFQRATFTGDVDFGRATFSEGVAFWGTMTNPVFDTLAWASFEHTRIDKPELVIFNTVLLHPGWFINTDMRNVIFTDVMWYGMPGGPRGTLDEEIKAINERYVQSPNTFLAQACRRLSANAEDSHEYPLANAFHYWSMDALRKESWDYRRETWDGLVWIRRNWLRVARRCGPSTALRLVWGRIIRRRRSRPRNFGLIPTLYWALSGYGVRATRAFWILFAIWLMFAALYFLLVESSPFWVFSASDIWQGIDYARQAAVYSLSALVRLNPRPQSEALNWFQTLVTIEGILGPLQIALLVLAIRRKVMR